MKGGEENIPAELYLILDSIGRDRMRLISEADGCTEWLARSRLSKFIILSLNKPVKGILLKIYFNIT